MGKVNHNPDLTKILLDALPCVALLLKPGTREIVASNKAAVAAGAVPGRQCYATWGGSDKPCPWCLAPKLWSTGEEQHAQFEGLGIIWDAHWLPISDQLYMHYAFDITNAKNAEQQLKASEERFRVLSQLSPVGVFVTDIDGKTIYWNKRLSEISGMSAEQGRGMKWIDAIHPDDIEAVFNEWCSSTDARENFKAEYRFIDREGRITWTLGQAVPMEISTGEIIGYLGTITDITKHKKYEEALLSSRNALEQQVRERTAELQEKNVALKVLLEQQENIKREMENNILSNVKSLIFPYINKLKRNNINKEDVSYLNIIESNLEAIMSPFSQRLSSKYMQFTNKEIQVADLIKEGKKDKEIMEIMNIAFDTVKAYRKNIRKKLGINGKRTNLRSVLLSMQ